MPVNSHNEWDKLREVIVGTADGSASVRTEKHATGGAPSFSGVPSSPVFVLEVAMASSLLVRFCIFNRRLAAYDRPLTRGVTRV